LSNPWFRLYHEFDSDPKVQSMPEVMQRRLIMLFCSKCRGETLQEPDRAFHWRISESELAQTKAVFLAKGFIDEKWDLLNWNRRQFLSDSSTDRVRKHRQAMKQDETLQKRDETKCNGTDTDTEAEQKQIKTKAASGAKAPVFVLPAGIDRKAWDGYEEMRRKRRCGLTDSGRELCMKKLESLKRAGHDPTAVLNQSTMNGWQGLFELKGEKSNGGARPSNSQLIETRKGFLESRRAGRMADGADHPGGYGETGLPGDGPGRTGPTLDAVLPHT
jgi:hypothetical protein